jgi:putative Holliday junction resolvase
LEPPNSSENQPLPTSGPLLGIDFGTVRIGLAVSDQGQKVAVPLTTYHRQEKRLDARYFLDLIHQEHIIGLVIGLPVHMSGTEGGKAIQARKFGAWLSQISNKPIHFIDERYTSVEAWNYLKEGGLKAAKRKKHVDKVAAQVLLQAYLDAKNAQQKIVIGPLHADSPSED